MNECILVVDDDAEIVAPSPSHWSGKVTGASRPTTVSRLWTCVWTRR